MIPNNVLSVTPVPAPFLYPRNIPVGLLESMDMGGVALNNPNDGLLVKAWTYRYQLNGDVTVESVDVLPVVLFNRPNITQISGTFDQNMNPFVSFTQGGVAKFWWYDSVAGMMVFTDLPVGSRYPYCSLDSKSAVQSSTSDVILSYIRDDNLYFRAQRDRYLIAYLLQSDLSDALLAPKLSNVGMNEVNRYQWAVSSPFIPV